MIKKFNDFVNEELTAKQKKLPKALQDAIIKRENKKGKKEKKKKKMMINKFE